MATPKLIDRYCNDDLTTRLQKAGVHPLLSKLWATRGVSDPKENDLSWSRLIAPSLMKGCEDAANILANAIQNNKKLLIVADYDCDGATACAVGIRALSAMGANVDYLVPNRFETGYGLSTEVVELAVNHTAGKPDLIITVDNGIASIDGVKAATEHGIEVIITDHHLPGDELPPAAAIVNPNQPECPFPSKNIAGVGVIYYLMMALRAELRKRSMFKGKPPRLDHLSDLVALGTVADVVKLDANNRLMVGQGLKRIRAGQMQVGLRALFAVAGREPIRASTFDMGFALGPRINAAGRLSDMSIGIDLLTTDDELHALELARELDNINKQRRTIEQTMHEQALDMTVDDSILNRASLCVYNPNWHQGVTGLVASRLKEKFWRPTLAFARSDDGELRASGRSVPDVHLRDVLDLVYKLHPGMIVKFGGHAMAAGLTLREEAYENSTTAFNDAVIKLSGRTSFEPIIETDGSLDVSYKNASVAEMLDQQIWGAGFPPPIFRDSFKVVSQRLLKDKHLKMTLQRGSHQFDAIWFNHGSLLPEHIEAAYRLDLNVWNGRVSAQLIIEHAE